eukprot:GHVU01127139.1.p2 GENE.GHVU01127139.1~~GHVU01127139.1.p2  ORF type:complete len:100 (-),score=7.81 GHVU01127139.1:223-522(-)
MAQRPHGQRPTTTSGERGKNHNRAQQLLTRPTDGKLTLAQRANAKTNGQRPTPTLLQRIPPTTYSTNTRRQTDGKRTGKGSRTHYKSVRNRGKGRPEAG